MVRRRRRRRKGWWKRMWKRHCAFTVTNDRIVCKYAARLSWHSETNARKISTPVMSSKVTQANSTSSVQLSSPSKRKTRKLRQSLNIDDTLTDRRAVLNLTSANRMSHTISAWLPEDVSATSAISSSFVKSPPPFPQGLRMKCVALDTTAIAVIAWGDTYIWNAPTYFRKPRACSNMNIFNF